MIFNYSYDEDASIWLDQTVLLERDAASGNNRIFCSWVISMHLVIRQNPELLPADRWFVKSNHSLRHFGSTPGALLAGRCAVIRLLPMYFISIIVRDGDAFLRLRIICSVTWQLGQVK